MQEYNFPGWSLLGRYPDCEDGVGSWLLHNGTEAALLEVPPGLTLTRIAQKLAKLGCELKYVFVSHSHCDHLSWSMWSRLQRVYPSVYFRTPRDKSRERRYTLGGEDLYVMPVPKHSPSDVVAVFRGVALTGDIELGQLESVNNEVPPRTKLVSMRYAAKFCERNAYTIHTAISAHLNDLRTGVDWESLWRCSDYACV